LFCALSRSIQQLRIRRGLDDSHHACTRGELIEHPNPGSVRHQRIEAMGVNSLDDYIDAVGKALALPIDESWKPAVKANLEVSLRLAHLVDEFPLPDETEPASVFAA
jgi:hypothetical protein